MQNEAFYNGSQGIESMLHFPAYSSLGMQPAEEPEDPPETLHFAWGLWLHHRDALHRIEQQHDITHVLRNARAADDILHYLDYVPKIGHDEHNIEIVQKDFDYLYSHEEQEYTAHLQFEEDVQGTETAIGILEEEITDHGKNDEMKDEEESLSEYQESENDTCRLKKDLTEILKRCEMEIWSSDNSTMGQ